MANNSQGLRPQYDDEISLVDLATTFLKRRRVFYAVFLLVTFAGVAYALFTPEKYEYVTFVKLAEKSRGEPIEKPSGIIAELDSLWVPDLKAAHHEEHERSLPFKITASNPQSTSLVRIVSETSPAVQELVESSHRQLIERLTSDQEQVVARLRKSLERQIKSLDSTIDMLEGGEDTGDAIASAIEKRLSLESELEALAPAEALVLSRQSAESTGPNKRLIVVLAGMLGLMGGVFLAFFAEFVALVRERAATTLIDQ